MIIIRPDHFTIVTTDLSGTEDFYVKLLGFKVGPRPDFPFPGSWLYMNDAAILHVMLVEEMPTPRKGVLDHMAFQGQNVNELLKRLIAFDLDYEIRRMPKPWNNWQIFFHDPNGAKVEIDFDASEVLEPEYQI